MNVEDKIQKHLDEIEKKYEISIIHAIESGSRSWGFASPDSDYDVRFIYVHKKDWYIQVFPKKDQIEIPISDELDMVGWDVSKVLRLASKGNSVVHEWIHTPIEYRRNSEIAPYLREKLTEAFNPCASYHHYRSLAKNALNDLRNKEQIKLKWFFYLLRALLSALWIKQNNTMPSIEFDYLLNHLKLDDIIIKEVKELIYIKSNLVESEFYETSPSLIAFVENHYQELDGYFPRVSKAEKLDWNKILVEIVNKAG